MKLTYQQVVDAMEDGAFDNFTNCPLPYPLQLKLKPLGTKLRQAMKDFVETEQRILKDHDMLNEETGAIDTSNSDPQTIEKVNTELQDLRETKTEIEINARIPDEVVRSALGNVPSKIFVLDWLIEFPVQEEETFDFAT